MPFSATEVIVQGLPESLVFVFFIYALLGLKAAPARILVLGLLHLGLTVIVRGAEVPIPAHTLVALIVMSVTISLWENTALFKVILGWGATMVVLIVSETSIALLAASILGVSLETLFAGRLVWILVGLPHIVVMALAAGWLYRRGGLPLFKVVRR